MVRGKEAIVVEGRYDTVRLSSTVDAVIVQTNGFRIFKDKAQLSLLRRLATERGLIVLTDSDAAGFLIRDHIDAAVPKSTVKHAYIPPVEGKESRKRTASKEGLLGVEGMGAAVLLAALRAAGATIDEECAVERVPFLTTSRLFEDGLTGGVDSKKKRQRLCERLSLPSYLSTARLMAVLNAAYSEDEYVAALENL
ncbi:MAG: DUF4093 domain-containing protein [Clostridia bacterium]|nr:DUF4093 domain-containing protein [Clostridia bacterium]